MNNLEIVRYISDKSSISEDKCKIILKSIEKRAEERLVEKFKGMKYNSNIFIEKVSERSGYSYEDCEIVFSHLNNIIKNNILEKFIFLKKFNFI